MKEAAVEGDDHRHAPDSVLNPECEREQDDQNPDGQNQDRKVGMDLSVGP